MSTIAIKSDLHELMVSWRHHLHKHPELSFKEEITSDYIASVLQSHDIEIHRGLAVTGIIAIILRLCISSGWKNACLWA